MSILLRGVSPFSARAFSFVSHFHSRFIGGWFRQIGVLSAFKQPPARLVPSVARLPTSFRARAENEMRASGCYHAAHADKLSLGNANETTSELLELQYLGKR